MTASEQTSDNRNSQPARRPVCLFVRDREAPLVVQKSLQSFLWSLQQMESQDEDTVSSTRAWLNQRLRHCQQCSGDVEEKEIVRLMIAMNLKLFFFF